MNTIHRAMLALSLLIAAPASFVLAAPDAPSGDSSVIEHLLPPISLSFDVQPRPDPTSAPPSDKPAVDLNDPKPAHGDSLAVKLQNPVADLISVPLQFNWDTGIGPDDDKDKITLNVQPVIPFGISEDWNLITRTIVPVIYAEGTVPGQSDEFGLGDTTLSLFFSPKKPIDGWIIGIGPAALIPTGTDDAFRTKQFGLGPTGVFLRQEPVGDFTLTYGILANHIWKVAGSDNTPDVNSTYLQPFIGITTKGGTSFFLNTETTYNWTDREWSVPLNLMMSQVVVFGHQPVQFQFGGRYYAETFTDGPEWGIRFTITFLFPE